MSTWKFVIESRNWYEVSDAGEVRSVERIITRSNDTMQTWKGKLLSTHTTSNGYKAVGVTQKGRNGNRLVHALVAEAFICNGRIPAKMVVNHIDGNKTNNKLENLEVITYTENIKHAHINGLNTNIGATHKGAKMTTDQIKESKELYLDGMSQYELARKYNITRSGMQGILNGRKRKTS